ncbi:MAG: hypothetical protein ACRDJY_00905 [Thermoleophilaceae bacterium]
MLFVALLIASFAISGEPPDADEPVGEIVEHYVDNDDAIWASTIVGGLAIVSLLFFGGYLRKLFAAVEPPGHGLLSPLVLTGAAIMAVGAGIDMTISVALVEAVEDVDPAAVQALQALWDNDFVPIAIGIVVLLLSCGLSIVKYGALPKWLGWVAIVIAAVGMTPVGFAAFPLGGIWVIITSILLAVRAGGPATPGVDTAT